MHASPEVTRAFAATQQILRFFLSSAAGTPPRGIATRSMLLARHRTLQLTRTDASVLVRQGCVWITRDGCPEDIVLEAGQKFWHTPGARVLVHALEDARLELARG